MLSVDYFFPTTVSVRDEQNRDDGRSFAATLRSLAGEPVVLISFMDCTYVDLATLAALAAHDASPGAQLIVIVPEIGYVRSQFRLCGMDHRLGIVTGMHEAYERARRVRSLSCIAERALESVSWRAGKHRSPENIFPTAF